MQKNSLDAVLSSRSVIVILLNPEGGIVHASPAFYSIFPSPPQSFLDLIVQPNAREMLLQLGKIGGKQSTPFSLRQGDCTFAGEWLVDSNDGQLLLLGIESTKEVLPEWVARIDPGGREWAEGILPALDSTVDGVSRLSKDGRYLYVNKQYAKSLGYDKATMIGMEWNAREFADDVSDVELAFDIMLEHNCGQATVRGVRKNGEIFHQHIVMVKSFNGFGEHDGHYCFLQDVEGWLDVLRKAEQYQRFFEMTNDLMCTASEAGYFLKVNKSFTRVLGYSAEELTSQPIVSFVHPDDVDETARQIRKVVEGARSLFYENRYICKDGSICWLSWSGPGEKIEGRYFAVARDITERKNFERMLLKSANYDALSGLPNRSYLLCELEKSLARADRLGECLVGIFVDLNDFKVINDKLGHSVGDEVIRLAAGRLRGSLRVNDFVARIGGDEFYILATFEDPSGINGLLDKVAAEFCAPFIIGEHRLVVSASMGCAVYPIDVDDKGQLFDVSDREMYLYKSTKKQMRLNVERHSKENNI